MKKQNNRQSIRLKGYDYSSPGEYFITICTHNRKHIFGNVVDGEMQLNRFGKIAQNEWVNTESIRDNVVLDTFIIMPNHMHAVFGIMSNVGAVGAYRDTPVRDIPCNNYKSKFRSPSKNVGAIVRGYKSAVTTKINRLGKSTGTKIWQRNYYEHIIRNDKSLNHIRDYIINNPAKWQADKFHNSL